MEKESWKTEIADCVDCLRRGGILLYPTDTVWGLGCDPENADALERLQRLKGRPQEKSLILLADDIQRMRPWLRTIPKAALKAISGTTRPLTIIYSDAQGLRPPVVAQDGSIAVRVTSDPFCRTLIAAFGKPLISTSANISGESFDGNYADVPLSIRKGADYQVLSRRDEIIEALPSRIVRFDAQGNEQIIRE